MICLFVENLGRTKTNHPSIDSCQKQTWISFEASQLLSKKTSLETTSASPMDPLAPMELSSHCQPRDIHRDVNTSYSMSTAIEAVVTIATYLSCFQASSAHTLPLSHFQRTCDHLWSERKRAAHRLSMSQWAEIARHNKLWFSLASRLFHQNAQDQDLKNYWGHRSLPTAVSWNLTIGGAGNFIFFLHLLLDHQPTDTV